MMRALSVFLAAAVLLVGPLSGSGAYAWTGQCGVTLGEDPTSSWGEVDGWLLASEVLSELVIQVKVWDPNGIKIVDSGPKGKTHDYYISWGTIFPIHTPGPYTGQTTCWGISYSGQMGGTIVEGTKYLGPAQSPTPTKKTPGTWTRVFAGPPGR